MIASKSATRDRRTLFATMPALILAIGACDYALLGRFDPVAATARVAWAGYFLAIASMATRMKPEHLDWSTAIGAAVSTAAWSVLAWRTGGSAGPFLAAMVALPLLFGVLAPDSVRSSMVASTSVVLGYAIVLGLEGAGIGVAIASLSLAVAMGAISIVGAVAYRRLRRAEVAVSRDRERALEDLAVSESRRLKAERMAIIGRLSSKLAHELNNPLAFVKSNLEFLAEEHHCEREESIGPAIADSREGLDRIEKIVSALGTFARMDDAHQETCGLDTLVDEAARLASLRIGALARLSVDLPKELPPIRANPPQLVQVFVIMLLNAADAIATGQRGTGIIEVRAAREGDRIRITVADDGPGVPAEIRPFVFEPFFTT
ncbi:MAG TPA: ATP-binding protein, partial [Vulgatibacter sp.]